ncbi:hypothetical protein FACS1894166_02220 [Bacilli bacterium]|nr:hypothetical protein FACS1894166_02220 [Bacilli bacterium]
MTIQVILNNKLISKKFRSTKDLNVFLQEVVSVPNATTVKAMKQCLKAAKDNKCITYNVDEALAELKL